MIIGQMKILYPSLPMLMFDRLGIAWSLGQQGVKDTAVLSFLRLKLSPIHSQCVYTCVHLCVCVHVHTCICVCLKEYNS